MRNRASSPATLGGHEPNQRPCNESLTHSTPTKFAKREKLHNRLEKLARPASIFTYQPNRPSGRWRTTQKSLTVSWKKCSQGNHVGIYRAASSELISWDIPVPLPWHDNCLARNSNFSAIDPRGAANMRVSRKRLVFALGLTLGLNGRAGAQGAQHRIEFVQSRPSSTIISSPHHALPLASSVLFIQRQSDFHCGYTFLNTANYQLRNADSLFSFHETKTLFATESRLPVAQIWGARLEVNVFAVTLYTRNVMLGPLAPVLQRPMQLRSVDLYGIGVSVPLGRDARWEGSKSLWRSLSQILHGNGWAQLSFSSPKGGGGLVLDCSSPSVRTVSGGEQELTRVPFPNQVDAPQIERDCK